MPGDKSEASLVLGQASLRSLHERLGSISLTSNPTQFWYKRIRFYPRIGQGALEIVLMSLLGEGFFGRFVGLVELDVAQAEWHILS